MPTDMPYHITKPNGLVTEDVSRIYAIEPIFGRTRATLSTSHISSIVSPALKNYGWLVITEMGLSGLWTWTPRRFEDERGWFSETFSERTLATAIDGLRFVQDNHSYSASPNMVRGLHFQIPPMAQDKLVRIVRGSVLDIAVDLRRGSQTFGQHVLVELSAKTGKQVFIPKGFAHGFVTLEPDTEVVYKVTAYYSVEHERAILWNDPTLHIDWGIDPADAILSEKDRHNPPFTDLRRYFA
jgi:dTDP-4-dehydrorhamnose 3,5-epimerase